MTSKSEPIYVLNKRVLLHQVENGFRTSMDSVLLAAACPIREGESVLDLGCGVGGAGLCVLVRVPGASLTGIDIQADHVDLARENAGLNGMKERAAFFCADVRDFQGDALFDHVVCNPPYLEAGNHMVSPYEAKAVAMGHKELAVKDWLDCGFRNLKNGGSMTMIHRADMIDKIIQGLGKRFGAVEIIPLWPREGQAAKRVIVRALKGRKSPAVMHPGLVLHEADGAYTAAADAVLREIKPLFCL